MLAVLACVLLRFGGTAAKQGSLLESPQRAASQALLGLPRESAGVPEAESVQPGARWSCVCPAVVEAAVHPSQLALSVRSDPDLGARLGQAGSTQAALPLWAAGAGTTHRKAFYTETERLRPSPLVAR